MNFKLTNLSKYLTLINKYLGYQFYGEKGDFYYDSTKIIKFPKAAHKIQVSKVVGRKLSDYSFWCQQS